MKKFPHDINHHLAILALARGDFCRMLTVYPMSRVSSQVNLLMQRRKGRLSCLYAFGGAFPPEIFQNLRLLFETSFLAVFEAVQEWTLKNVATKRGSKREKLRLRQEMRNFEKVRPLES